MPPGRISLTDRINHALVLRIYVDPKRVLNGYARRIHVVNVHWNNEDVIIALDVRMTSDIHTAIHT